MPPVQERFFTAIHAGDFAGALDAAREARERGIEFLYEDVVTPALVRIGELWRAGRLSVADEHIATAITQSVLASFYSSFPWVAGGPKAIVACVEGERHELGARMAADLLALDGWNVRFVGADVPKTALVNLVSRERPVFVGISVGMREHLTSAADTVAKLRREAPATRLIVGGRAVADLTAPPPLLDVNALAPNAASAVSMVRSWKL